MNRTQTFVWSAALSVGLALLLTARHVGAGQEDPEKAAVGAKISEKLPLKNAGAEEGEVAISGWARGAQVDGVAYNWDKSVAHSGKASLSIKKTAQRYFPIAQWHQSVKHTGKSKKVMLTAQVKADAMTKGILDIQFIDAQGDTISHTWAAYIGGKDGQPPATHDWKQYAGVVEIPDKTAEITVALQVYGPGTVWFDDIELGYVAEGKAKP